MTTFQTPIKGRGASGDTGLPQTDTTGYTSLFKVVPLGVGAASRQIVSLPANATLLRAGGATTSAFAADVSACNINFGNSADATHYGVISVSAIGQVRNATVSAAAEFDAAGGTIIITLSAVSTTTFTVGGARAFIEYVVTE